MVVLLFENSAYRTTHTRYYLSKKEIKDYNIIISESKLLDQPVKSDIRTNEKLKKITTGQENYNTSSCLLDYTYFKEDHGLIAIDLNN